MSRQGVTWLILSWLLVACTSDAPGVSSSPTIEAPIATATATAPPTPSPTTAPSPTSATTIVLHEAPANLGCDTIGIDYRSMTFHIDSTAEEQVSAETDTGVMLTTHWSAGFQPGADTERVVRDPAGKLVMADGDVLAVPPATFPRLAGYFVCLAPDKLYVLLTDPS